MLIVNFTVGVTPSMADALSLKLYDYGVEIGSHMLYEKTEDFNGNLVSMVQMDCAVPYGRWNDLLEDLNNLDYDVTLIL